VPSKTAAVPYFFLLCFHFFSPFKFRHTKLFFIFGNTKYKRHKDTYTLCQGGDTLRTRKLELGDRNLIGARVTQARNARSMKQVDLLAKLQLAGIEMSIPALSLLEGQKRPVSDIGLNALADVLEVSVNWLLGRE
jgi:hypothetical protein